MDVLDHLNAKDETRHAFASVYTEILRSAQGPMSIPDVLVLFVPHVDF
jgi:hypothetical protein